MPSDHKLAPWERPFGHLTPLLAPLSIAVIGSSDREGNLGGVAVRFLKKFKYAGAIWPVNPQQTQVAELTCYPTVDALPGVPDMAILALPAAAIEETLRACAAKGILSAVVWAGGFAETGPEGAVLQERLRLACVETGIQLCGPNCIGIINTANAISASFSNLLYEQDQLLTGSVSLVSQSGGISVNVLSRARALGYGMRVTVSVGNEVGLGLSDFIRVLACDPGTKVIAVYTEGLSNPQVFVQALEIARANQKPVVMLKGGASEASSHAALAHTGRLAGMDRTFSAILQEFGVIRVFSTEEMIDVCGQLSCMPAHQLPSNRDVLVSTFGGGSGVITTDQCAKSNLSVTRMKDDRMALLSPNLTPMSACFNPVDMTPGVMTNPALRQKLPLAFACMNEDPQYGAWLFMASGFGDLAPQLVDMLCAIKQNTEKTILVTWQSMPEGLSQLLQERGIYVFSDSARAVKTLSLICDYADMCRQTQRQLNIKKIEFDWQAFTHLQGPCVISEHQVAGLLTRAQLPVANGQLVELNDSLEKVANNIGFPLVMKAISAQITHRAAAGLVALSIDSLDAMEAVKKRFVERAQELNVKLDGLWVQHMFAGNQELLVTSLRDSDFGVMVGIGMGGQYTEIFDDIVFARAPLDVEYAKVMIRCLRTIQRLPNLLSESQIKNSAEFLSLFSSWVASAPWIQFNLEINPIKLGPTSVAAVDGLLIIE